MPDQLLPEQRDVDLAKSIVYRLHWSDLSGPVSRAFAAIRLEERHAAQARIVMLEAKLAEMLDRRRFEAAVAVLEGMCSNANADQYRSPAEAVSRADALLAALDNTKPT